MELHNKLLKALAKLPTDYEPWGQVERWKNGKKNYPDCSMGCRYASWLSDKLKYDWCVCVNQKSPRFGLLTYEHQAGLDCFVSD